MKQATVITAASRRASNKKKLQALEWSNEAIEQFSNSLREEEEASTKSSTHGPENEIALDTMESKIARVQQKKKENDLREQRRKTRPVPQPRPESVLTRYKNNNNHSSVAESNSVESDSDASQGLAKKLAASLNSYFRKHFAETPSAAALSSADVNFPLECYDHSTHNEALPVQQNHLPMFGACLLTETRHEASLLDRLLGTWYACKVLHVHEPEDADSTIEVELSDTILGETYVLPRVHVCLVAHDAERYAARVLEAFSRRSHCVNLLQFDAMVAAMPVNESVVCCMTQEQYNSIYKRAASTSKLLALDFSVASAEIDEACREFELCMNRTIFIMNMMSITNRTFLRSLKISKLLLLKGPKAPQCALFPIPPHHMAHRLSHLRNHSFLQSSAAIFSLHSMLHETSLIQDYTMVKVEYSRSFTLEKFDRYVGEQVLSSVRRIKQEWTQRCGAGIRNAITKGQIAVEGKTPIGIQYDISARNVYEYEKSLNPIKSFLERVNFFMSHELIQIVRRNVLHYARLIEQFCACEVEVRDVRSIIVQFPTDSIYKARVLPPLFTVAFRIAAEEKMLNKAEYSKYVEDMDAWKLTKECEAGEKCPVAVVKPVMGKSFEYSHSVEEFRNVLLKFFKQIVNEFSEVPHVQKYVMDRVYFPVPKYVNSVTHDMPWVLETGEKLLKAIETATTPLTKYLKFFDKYESYVNIDNAAYIQSKIQVVHRDPDSTEIELPVTVNVEQVISLVSEHLLHIKDVEDSLPVTPIECGLFLVEVMSVRQLLLDKHKAIIRNILTAQAERCSSIVQYLDDEFKKIARNLSKKPENIEQLTELEEYLTSLTATLNTLQGCIAEMMSNFSILDRFKHKLEFDLGSQMWHVFAAPTKIADRCVEVTESNVSIKRRFKDEMMGEQVNFTKSMVGRRQLLASYL